MNVKEMTLTELKNLKTKVDKELYLRNHEIFNQFITKLVSTIEDFEKETGLFVNFEGDDFTDTAVNTIKECMFFSTEKLDF